jgi:hypothetical protein
MQAPIVEVSHPPIAARFGYLAQVQAVAGAEQCFALLPVNASLIQRQFLSRNHHGIADGSIALECLYP